MNLPALTSTHAAAAQLPQTPNKTRRSPPPSSRLTHHQNQTQPIIINRNPTSKPNLSLKKQFTNAIDPTVLWTSSITRHCRSGQLHRAAAEFAQMRISGVEPNHITIISLLSGCADFPSEGKYYGPLIHAYARKLGLDVDNVMVGTAVVDMYAKCGGVELARLCFDELKVKNSMSWNTMIDGYMRNGEIEDAILLFDEMPERGTITWTVLIDGFVKRFLFEEALDCFREMQGGKVEPDYVTIIAVLAACANLGALGLGLWVHRYVLKQEFRDNVRVCNSLIDMYARCGCIDLAYQVFQKMVKRTLVSWNSIIVGFAANGLAEEALEHFNLMQKEGFKPDGVSFTGALTACSHAGLVDQGVGYFNTMMTMHRINPRIEHYGCLVDLYSRAGRLDDALSVIESMSMKPNEVVLGSLLAACRIHEDVDLAERLTKYLVDLDPDIDSNYVLLSNLYAAVGRWDGASTVRRHMKARGIQKRPGFSSVEIGCGIYEFVASDKSHVETEDVYAMLELLCFDLKLEGYIPDATVRNTYQSD